MNLVSRFTLLAAAALAAPVASSGQIVPGTTTVVLDYTAVDPNSGTTSVHAGGGTGTFYSGVLSFTGSNQLNPPNPPDFVGALKLFCVELSERVLEPGTATYRVDLPQFASANSASPLGSNIPTTGIGLERALNLQLLYGNAFGTITNYSTLLGSWTADQKRGFQIAVWELSHDDDLLLTNQGGLHFWVTSTSNDALTFATSLVNSVKLDRDNNDFSGQIKLIALHNDTQQDQLMPHDSGSIIPEPSTWAALIGLASLGFVAVRRFRRKAA